MEKKTHITIKDIARELNISPSTVSRALKDHPDISQSTKDAVKSFASKYNYKPNKLALNFRKKHTNTIGVIIPQVVHFFFSSIISGIEKIASEEGYNVMICQSNEEYEREVNNVMAFIENRVEGVLVSVSKNTFDFSHFQDLQDEDIPLVFFDRVAPGFATDHVIVDDAKGAFYATEHLIQVGCRKIAHLSAPQNLIIGKERVRGFKEAHKKYNLPFYEDLIIKCDSREEALVITTQLMQSKHKPDGFFAVNDLTASGTLRALKSLGYKIPQDVAVVGFSDGLVANVTDPTLSTIEQHGFEMGVKAAILLFDRIKSPDSTIGARSEVIKTNLVIRESSKKI